MSERDDESVVRRVLDFIDLRDFVISECEFAIFVFFYLFLWELQTCRERMLGVVVDGRSLEGFLV